MKVYYAPDLRQIFVEGTAQLWPPLSLIVSSYPDGLYICTALTGVCILGPLTPGLVQRQDGTTFADLPSAVAYLQGEFARFSADDDGAPIVSAAPLAAGTPVAVSRATGQIVAARADAKPLAFVAGVLREPVEAGFPVLVSRGAVMLVDWTTATGAAALLTGQAYFLAPAGGLTTTPSLATGLCATRVGIADTTTTLIVAPTDPIQL